MTYPDPSQFQQSGTPYLPGNPGVPDGGPLAGLQDSVSSVLNSADPRHAYLPGPGGEVLQYPRGLQPSIARDMAFGAAAGFAGWLVWRRMQRRKAAKGEYTSPGFRFVGVWWLFVLAGFGLSMAWPLETGWLLGSGVVLGSVLSLAFLIYRATGHGRYNTRRAGSPWRAGHHPQLRTTQGP